MKNRNWVLIIALCLVGNLTSAQNYIFKGVIGGKPAVLGLTIEGKDISNSNYYLEVDRAVIHLESNRVDSNQIILYSLDANNEDTLSRFYLKFEDNGHQLNGIYAANDLLKEEVYFKWLDITKLSHNYPSDLIVKAFKTENPLLYTYTSNLTFESNIKNVFYGKYDKITLVKNKAYSIPSIRFATSNAAEKRIEKFTDSIGLEQIVAAIDCGLEYEVSLVIKRFDRNIVSLLYKVSWNCNTRPDFYYQGYTFNRKTGNLIELKNMFNLPSEETNNDSMNKVNVKMNEIFIRTLVKDTLVNDGGSLCDYDNYPLFADKNYFLDKESIHFLPYFPKALETCRGSELSNTKISTIMPHMNLELKVLFIK